MSRHWRELDQKEQASLPSDLFMYFSLIRELLKDKQLFFYMQGTSSLHIW